MITAEQIPDEVVSKILIRFPLVFSGQHEARAILTAMLNAWPDGEVFSIMSDDDESIVLPLPKEPRP
jgi:hypothetical protein